MVLQEEDWAELYTKYGAVIYRRTFELLADREASRDAVHDIFLLLHRKISTFRGEADILTWIYRATTNHCLNRLRSRRIQRQALSRLKESTLKQSAGDPESTYQRRELICELLRQFSTRKSQIIIHSYYDEMTQSEIAQVMGISERAVRKAIKSFKDKAGDARVKLERIIEDKT